MKYWISYWLQQFKRVNTLTQKYLHGHILLVFCGINYFQLT